MTSERFTTEVLPLRNTCYRFALSMLHNGPEAEDLAQEVLMKLWERRSELVAIQNVEAWAVRATRNLALDRMRHSSWRTGDIAVVYDAASEQLPADQTVEQREAVRAVFDCMEHLPETQRAVLHLREVEALSYEEIGRALSLSPPQVKVYLHRARKRVRSLMDPSHAPNQHS